MGSFYYNFWQDAQNRRGIWRRTSLDQYRKSRPDWETVLDLDALARSEKENWIYKGSVCRQPEFDRCLIQLSRGHNDAVVVREFDLTGRQFVKNGYTLPEAHSNVAWRDKNSIFVATRFGADSYTDSGRPRIVKIWRRDTPLASAATVFTGSRADADVTGYSIDHPGLHRDLIRRRLDGDTSEYDEYANGRLIRLDVPPRAVISFFGSQLLVSLHQDWITKEGKYAGGALLAINFDAFKKGSRRFTTLFAPTPHSVLTAITATKNYLLVQSLDDVNSALTEWKFSDQKWLPRTVRLPTIGNVTITALDADHSNQYFLMYSDFLMPDTLMLMQAGSDQREGLKRAAAVFNADLYQIQQQQASSRDGTSIPYFIVHRKDMPLNGQNPTLLYGDGGFGRSLTPGYAAGVGLGWLQKGGVLVVANIRGGGEFGPAWHDAAVRQNRQNAYDDFAAVAQELITAKVTDTRHLGTLGEGNGGLLAGVMLVQHPELFHAIVCQSPLLDMQRYNKMQADRYWEAEYGNPDVPAEWAYLSQYSPYQNVKAERSYPNVLFITATSEDPVHPGHARKMAARMLEQGHNDVRFFENTEGGHDDAADSLQRADMEAIKYIYLQKLLFN